MANFQRQYTGENTAVRLPSSEGLQRSQDNMNALIRQADEIQYKAFRENEKRFADMGDIDLETYLSTASANAQSEMLQQYNDVAAKILKKRGGKYEQLTPNDWQELNIGRKLLEAKQKSMLADQERYKTEKQMVERDPVRYNLNKFNEQRALPYLKTGEYPIGELPLNPLPFTTALSEGNRLYQGEVPLPVEEDKARRVRRTVTQKRSEEQARQYIEDTIMTNDRARTDVLEKFDKLPESDKEHWLGQGGNGVVEWAKNNPEFIEAAKGIQYSNWANIPQPRAAAGTGSVTSSMNVGEFVSRIPYGDIVYTDSYRFPAEKVLRGVNTENGKIIKRYGAKDLLPANISGRLLVYNPARDVLVMETVSASESARTETTMIVEIPAKNLMGIDDIPIMIDGRKSTVGELRKQDKKPQKGRPY